jgi:universal stress protein A
VPDEQTLLAAKENLTQLAQRLGLEASNRQVVTAVSTKEGILEAAVEHQADLIVVGSHGRHGFALLLGSTANAVMHGAPCDVLAVRIQEKS